MPTIERIAEKTECIARELLEYAQELRRGEGDWRWQPATLRSMQAIRDQLTFEENGEVEEPHTFEEFAAA